eukprot:5232231-Ditylum_brightwellii.AAC.1
MGYKGSTVLQLLQHLYMNYGQLDSTKLTANNDEICADYDPTAPIKNTLHTWRNAWILQQTEVCLFPSNKS